jgi:hypothetical protein
LLASAWAAERFDGGLKDRRALCTPGALRTDRRSLFELIRLG